VCGSDEGIDSLLGQNDLDNDYDYGFWEGHKLCRQGIDRLPKCAVVEIFV